LAKKKGPDRLKGVLDITLGPQAQGRKVHNQSRPQPGEIRSAQTPEDDRDRLDRAIKRSYDASLVDQELLNQDRPRPGEILTADVGKTADQVEDERVKKFLRLAQERFKLCADATADSRQKALDDLNFRVGEQWPADIQMQRQMDGRPCLTMNRLPQFIRQVTNEQRQQRPAIQVNPVGDGADQDTAEVLQGIIRHIEVNSDAEIAYDTAFEQCVTSGFGYWRILTDYISDKSFDQEILIKRVKNPFTVYVDPASIEPDESDARYKFLIEDMPASEYRVQYPNTQAASLGDFQSVGDNAPDWASRDTIRVAEYWHVEENQTQVAQLADGTVIPAEQVPEGAQVINRRNVLNRKVMWSKINAVEIIEEREWPGYWIPLVPVLGDDIEVNGKRHLAGLVRSFKDPQRMYNYWVSAATEMIALAPKAPFIGAEGQFENHENEWAQANVRNFAKLEYKPVSISGTPVGPPQRQVFEPPIQSINLMTRQSDNDMKAVTGIYDASLGEKGPEQSGKAILARQKQGDVATLNYADNLSRSIRHTGRLLIDLIPHIYDAPRVQRIIKPDQSVDHVIVHNQQPDGAQSMLSQSINKIYDIGTGRYDVTVSVGPSYQSKRQESVASMMALVQAYPEIMPIAGDLLVRNMDWPGAKEMADRLKKTLPPQLQPEADQDDPEAQLAKTQSQLNQVMQQHDALVQALNQANEVIRTKQVETQGKSDIERMKIEAQLTIAEIGAKSQELQTRIKMEQQLWAELHNAAHEQAMQATAPPPEPTGGAPTQ